MKAIIYEGPGKLAYAECPVPEPAATEVLVKVSHVGICGSDMLLWDGGFPRVTPPVVVGHEFAGTVVNRNHASELREGESVAIEPLITCGSCTPCRTGRSHVCRALRLLGADTDGGAAEYAVVPAERAHPVPDTLPLRDAALAEPLAVAVHMARRAGVRFGDRVVILGGGPVGALIACVCRTAGVADVVISEPSIGRRNVLAQMGLCAIDGSSDSNVLLERTRGEGFDVAFEVAGAGQALAQATELTRVSGTILLGGLPGAPLPLDVDGVALREQAVVGSRVYESGDFREALRLLAEGVVPAQALVTREVPLDEAIPRGFEPLHSGRDEMKILISIAG